MPASASVSVVICTHRSERFGDFLEAVESLKAQSFTTCGDYVNLDLEIVVVVDGNRELFERILKAGVVGQEQGVKTILNEQNLGLSESRNRGIKEAKGDVIAFFDDDAVADKKWLRELLRAYSEGEEEVGRVAKLSGAIAAGGKILPMWISNSNTKTKSGRPKFLPEEFYWLLGVTHKGFAESEGSGGLVEVRNTFGSNLSFKAEVLRALGGFRTEMGVKGRRGLLQGEETELCERMRERFGQGVVYNPAAVVYHKIYPERLKLRFLLRRAFWQGYSKRMMKEAGSSVSEEEKFVRVLFGGVVERLKAKSLVAFGQLAVLLLLTSAVGLGYFFKFFKGKKNHKKVKKHKKCVAE